MKSIRGVGVVSLLAGWMVGLDVTNQPSIQQTNQLISLLNGQGLIQYPAAQVFFAEDGADFDAV
ncbi:MAG: hypothetical protein KDI79_00330, partial [Anaerolineae bacterium]|nr:hypothetical protein [Anaerolineae bacterium]